MTRSVSTGTRGIRCSAFQREAASSWERSHMLPAHGACGSSNARFPSQARSRILSGRQAFSTRMPPVTPANDPGLRLRFSVELANVDGIDGAMADIARYGDIIYSSAYSGHATVIVKQSD